jgi:hypothetical protein
LPTVKTDSKTKLIIIIIVTSLLLSPSLPETHWSSTRLAKAVAWQLVVGRRSWGPR